MGICCCSSLENKRRMPGANWWRPKQRLRLWKSKRSNSWWKAEESAEEGWHLGRATGEVSLFQCMKAREYSFKISDLSAKDMSLDEKIFDELHLIVKCSLQDQEMTDYKLTRPDWLWSLQVRLRQWKPYSPVQFFLLQIKILSLLGSNRRKANQKCWYKVDLLNNLQYQKLLERPIRVRNSPRALPTTTRNSTVTALWCDISILFSLCLFWLPSLSE